ncbi:OmpA family protein [Geomonas sp. RF6]|uniref:OmpA family protein n=1 Tax=Geomonas sp. RF6 TaxID=2897342 RepID=UPI001E5C4A1E|nr:OmpA family protein [Geomonas sp. RF6]UFS70492.1 OmpA family protein [Geomonas sp. RF6]
MTPFLRLPPAYCCCLLLLAILSGCAAPKSYVVLLPKEGEPPGEVVVSTLEGSQVLNQPWEKVEIRNDLVPPGKPERVGEMNAQSEVLKVLSALPPQPVHFVLFFHFNSTELTAQSQRLLPEIVRCVQQRPAAEVIIVGHTDTVASEPYNYDLATRRARKVLNLLQKMGAAPLRVDLLSRGECELKVQTPDQTSESCNRRAEVTVR